MFLKYNSSFIPLNIFWFFPFHHVIWKVWKSVICSVRFISRRFVLSIFLFQTAERSIITCIRRNERHNNNSSGNSASKISLTIVHLRRTKVYNKLHNFYKWTTRKITHLKLFETPINIIDILHVHHTIDDIHACCTLGLSVFMYICSPVVSCPHKIIHLNLTVGIGPISKTQLRTDLIAYLYKRNLDHYVLMANDMGQTGQSLHIAGNKSNRKTAIITLGIQVEIYKCPLFTSLRKILCIAITQFLNSYYDVAHCGRSKII